MEKTQAAQTLENNKVQLAANQSQTLHRIDKSNNLHLVIGISGGEFLDAVTTNPFYSSFTIRVNAVEVSILYYLLQMSLVGT